MSWKPAKKPSRFPDWVPLWLRRLIRWSIKWGLVALTLLLAIALFYFYLAYKYELKEVARMPERSVMLDRHGIEFDSIHGERRRSIMREEIPEFMVEALRAREDLRFPDHNGIDMRGLARAAVRNIRDMSFSQGASTLTMQLTRNTYELRAKSLHRKLLEMAITLRIEGRYSKDEILTHYLNRIYFGAGCHGVEEAAQTYFGRSISKLNEGECALLVGIIRGPHLFSPFRNLDGAKVQRDEVLGRMVVCGFLSEEEKKTAMNHPIRLVAAKDRHRNSSYVRETIRNRLELILAEQNIRSGGLKIHTTVDAALQKKWDTSLSSPFPGIEKKEVSALQGAVISIDPETGGVLALNGGRSYEASPFNRAYLAKRDLGPAFEPFLTSIALERNKIAIPGQPVQTGRQLGVEETIRLAKRLGFTGSFVKSEDIYRGAMAASPVELARAAGTLMAGGRQADTYLIDRITDAEGNVLYQHELSVTQVIRQDAANEAAAILGKEGKPFLAVTRSRRDAWAVSAGKDNVTVIWLGHNKPQTIAPSAVVRKVLRELLP